MPDNTPTTEFTLVEQAMGNPPGWLTYWGITVVSLFLSIVLGIAAVISYPDVLQAKATTYINRPPVEVFAKQTKTINTLLVQEKDTIECNTPLIIFESSAAWEAVLTLDTLLKNKNTPINTKYLLASNLGTLNTAYQELVLLEQQIKDAYTTDITPDRIRTIKKEIEQNKALNASLLKQKEVFEKELNNIRKDWERSKTLLQDGVISPQEFEQKENVYWQSKRSFHQMESTLISNQIKIQQLSLQIPESEKQKHDFFFKLTTERSKKYEVLKTAIGKWKKEHILYAPIAGVLEFNSITLEGNQISPDIPVLTILPNTAQKQAFLKALMDANGIGKVAVGQKATVSFNNYPSAEYGILTAEVIEIAPIPTDNQYEVLLKLPQSWVTNYGVSIPKQQKMNAHIAIQTKEFTLLERIFSGLLDVLKN